MKPPPVVLTVAGSDSGGGAGIQADLKTFQALGLYGLSAVTAVTAQNTRGVRAVEEVTPHLVAAQIDAVAEDFEIGAVKTGMLPTAEIIEMVAERLRHWNLDKRLVVDPVIAASSGDRLMRTDALRALIERLLPLAAVVTPNLPEAAALTGRPVRNEEEIREAARRLVGLGARAAVVKGGHRDGEPVDVLFDGRECHTFGGRRIQTQSTHGTGCTFSAAVAAHLAGGAALVDAVANAKEYVTGALTHAPGLGHGRGPLAHDWPLTRQALR